jgi:alpha-glucosidase
MKKGDDVVHTARSEEDLKYPSVVVRTPQGACYVPSHEDIPDEIVDAWDDVKFVDGFPGQFVVLARRAGKTWYVAGINADGQPRKVTVDPAAFGTKAPGTLITDGGDALGFKSETFPLERGASAGVVEMRDRGGFVLTLDIRSEPVSGR